jgi:hypothetical protein
VWLVWLAGEMRRRRRRRRSFICDEMMVLSERHSFGAIIELSRDDRHLAGTHELLRETHELYMELSTHRC